MGNWRSIVFGVFTGLLSAGLILLISNRITNTPFELLPSPTPKPLTIHVTGGVISPGVYQIPVESRTIDAITAAGGFSSNAADGNLNLAEKVSDGQKIIVPLKNENQFSQSDTSANLNGQTKTNSQNLINVNIADLDLLSTLPGIGPTKAEDIIAYRNAHGAFLSIDELMKVNGIGPVNYEKIKDLVTLR